MKVKCQGLLSHAPPVNRNVTYGLLLVLWSAHMKDTDEKQTFTLLKMMSSRLEANSLDQAVCYESRYCLPVRLKTCLRYFLKVPLALIGIFWLF